MKVSFLSLSLSLSLLFLQFIQQQLWSGKSLSQLLKSNPATFQRQFFVPPPLNPTFQFPLFLLLVCQSIFVLFFSFYSKKRKKISTSNETMKQITQINLIIENVAIVLVFQGKCVCVWKG